LTVGARVKVRCPLCFVLTSSTNRNSEVINYQYDPLNRLTTEVWLNSSNQIVNTLTFAYDLNNNVTMASSSAGTYTMAYNALNEMTSETEPFSVVLGMQYDAVGDPTQVQDSFGGTTTYSYDALHRLTSILFNGTGSQTPLRVDLTYTQQNELGTVTRYSDLAGSNKIGATSYTYDPGMRLTNIQDANGTGGVLESLTYTYDAANRLTSLTQNGSITTYSYDTVNELTTVTTSGGATAYSYDANGNRTMPGYVTGTGNELLNDGTWTYTYDKEGNVTQKYNPSTGETWHYTYDNLNELTGVTDVSGTGTTLMQVTYVYDVFGQRIEKDVWTQAAGTTVTRYAHNENGQVWAQLNSSNGLATRYIRGNTVDELFARESSTGTVAWYLADHEGSVTNILDASGTVQDTITYDAYGKPTQTNPLFGDEFLYAEGQYDPETGLQYNLARYYNPQTGRWMSQDPMGFAAGDSDLYRYVGNAPTNATDPFGYRGKTAKDADTKVAALIDGMNLPPDVKAKVKKEVQKLLDATRFDWPHWTGFWGKCYLWVDEYDKKTRQLQPILAQTMGKYFKVGQMYWDSKPPTWFYGVSPGGGVYWYLSGAGHAAIVITFADGTIIYLDDGNLGGAGHVFFPGDVPSNYKPTEGYPRPVKFDDGANKQPPAGAGGDQQPAEGAAPPDNGELADGPPKGGGVTPYVEPPDGGGDDQDEHE
jgi:RHS repeat-associated protein